MGIEGKTEEVRVTPRELFRRILRSIGMKRPVNPCQGIRKTQGNGQLTIAMSPRHYDSR